jgi:hypothetical protein
MFQFRSCAGSRNDQIRFRRDRTCDLGTERFRTGFGFVAGHPFERTREDHYLARHCGIGGTWRGIIHDFDALEQAANSLARMLLVEKCLYRSRHDIADTLDCVQIFNRVIAFHRGEECLQRMEVARQQSRRAFAHVRNREGKYKPIQRDFAARINRAEQLACGLLAFAFHDGFGALAVAFIQVENISGLAQQTVFEKLRHGFFTQSLDVESIA